MRKFLIAAAILCLSGSAAHAGDTDGKIESIDAEAMTIVVNGNTYKLPGEFDPSIISEGMEVLIAFDEVNGVNLITDMELYE